MCDTNELDPENWPVSDDLDESAGGIGVGRLIYLLAKVFFQPVDVVITKLFTSEVCAKKMMSLRYRLYQRRMANIFPICAEALYIQRHTRISIKFELQSTKFEDLKIEGQ